MKITGYEGFADEPFISRDGQYLFFNDPNGDIFYANRITDVSFELIGTVQGLDPSAKYNGVASMDEAGNIYFVSATSPTTYRIYRGTFTDGTVTDVSVLDITGDQAGQDQEISADGQTLFYMVPKPTDSTATTLVMASKNADGSFTKRADSDDLLLTSTPADGL